MPKRGKPSRTGLLTNDSGLLRPKPAAAIIARSHERARIGPRLRKTRVLQAFFSSDGSYVVQFLVIFLVILVLLIGGFLLFRRLSGRGMSLTAGANARGRQPRLGIVDIYELDRQRQLILLRRDNVEHLLLVGGPNDVVIERHIQRGAGARYAPDGAREPDLAADPALDAARAEKFLDSPAPPAFAMPEVVPPAVPGAEPPHPERTPPLDPGLFEPETPAPARARPASPVSRLIRRTPPPLGGAVPEAAQGTPAPAVQPVSLPASEPVPETPPVIAGRGPRPVDPAVLSDMARQLQVALKRPSSAVTPPPGGAEVPPLPPAPDLRLDLPPDPLTAAVAAAPAVPPAPAPAKPAAPPPPAPTKPAPAKAETPAAPAPKPAEVKPAEAKPAPEQTPEVTATPVPAPLNPAPPPAAPAKPAPAKPAPAKPAEAAPKPAPEPKPAPQPAPPKPEARKPDPAAPAAETTAQNPFSVEEIEAEFARLLGRPLDNKN